MDVTDILRDRMQEPSGLPRMFTVSAILHAGLITAMIAAPHGLWTHERNAPRQVMTITLGPGSGGPQNGGMTAMGGRPVQVQKPPEEAAKREAVRPPAAKTPEMTLPKPDAKPLKATANTPVKQAPDEARGRTPTRGSEVTSGSAVAETGSRGQGFGLSTGGGPGSGSALDVSDFCCPEYVALMLERIRSSWDQRAETSGAVVVRFTIERDGHITETMVERPSGYAPLDISAQRAVLVTRQLPPLPAGFPNPTLTVHLNFQYQR